MTSSDPAAAGNRRPSAAPLVNTIRREVNAWRAEDYAGASTTSKRLLEHWFLDEHQTGDGAPFEYYFAQREAIETIVYLYEVVKSRDLADLVSRYASDPVPVPAQQYPRYVVKAATGSGKTKVMSMGIIWSYFHSMYEPDSTLATSALVIAPNLIVFERLREDFGAGRIFYRDPLIPPEWRSDFELPVTQRHEPIPEYSAGVLVLTNVQALYERPSAAAPINPVAALIGPRPKVGSASEPTIVEQLASRGKVLVVNDEAHHLHDEIKAESGEPLVAIQRINALDELASRETVGGGVSAQLDFSATPRNQQGRLFPETVVDYPLAQAIEDKIVKRPVIGELSGRVEVASDDASVRYKHRIGAGVQKWREFRDNLARAGKKPLLFVMAEDTTAADQISAYLNTLHDLSGRVLTIHVNMVGKNKGEVKSDELEVARRAAREADSPDNPYAAIVSVLMLREGWDVRNVSVIVPLRAYTAKSQILPEQTLGRGLRRMTPQDSGVDEQLVVIEHEAFRDLWDKALADEGLALERINASEVRQEARVIAVDPEKTSRDIEIPQLTRTLVRSVSQVSKLRVRDIPRVHVRLPDELRTDTVDYTGRDLLTGDVVDRARYPIPQSNDSSSVLAWYVNELQRDTRLTGQFAVLAPLVKEYISGRVFGREVTLDDPLVLQRLAEPFAQEAILGALRQAVDLTTLVRETPSEDSKAILLSATRPFLWSGLLIPADKSIFSGQPCDNEFEAEVARFLDRAHDVEAFAKLAREVRFSLEYRSGRGRLAYYYPDFVCRLIDGSHYILEAKGRVDLEVPRKDVRARRWAVDASQRSGTEWRYLRLNQDLFESNVTRVGQLDELVAIAAEATRQEFLMSQPPTRSRSRAEILAAMDSISDTVDEFSAFDVDKEIRGMREDPRG